MRFKKINLSKILGSRRAESTPKCNEDPPISDRGNAPYAFNACELTKNNENYRTAIWTGKHLQITLMSIPVGEDTGLEMHDGFDQFIMAESGEGVIEMGRAPQPLSFRESLYPCRAAVIPASTYHVIRNTSNVPLKLFSVYAPAAHRFGTVDKDNPEKINKPLRN